MASMSKKKKNKQAEVHEELEHLDIKINRLGQLEAGYDIDKINDFLTENVDDRRLSNREEE